MQELINKINTLNEKELKQLHRHIERKLSDNSEKENTENYEIKIKSLIKKIELEFNTPFFLERNLRNTSRDFVNARRIFFYIITQLWKIYKVNRAAFIYGKNHATLLYNNKIATAILNGFHGKELQNKYKEFLNSEIVIKNIKDQKI